jgi:hypothetical protein
MAHKSIIETKGLLPLLGNTPDEKVAELAGLHPESVRIYRVRRRIPARWMGETAVGETSIRPLRVVAQAQAQAQAPAPAPTPAPAPATVAPVALAQEPQAAARKYRTSAIVSAEDCDGRTTTNEGNAQNIITVYTPTQTARTKTKARVTLSIQHGEDSVLTLKGTAVHTLFRVLSAHYGRPLPRNGWDE